MAKTGSNQSRIEKSIIALRHRLLGSGTSIPDVVLNLTIKGEKAKRFLAGFGVYAAEINREHGKPSKNEFAAILLDESINRSDLIPGTQGFDEGLKAYLAIYELTTAKKHIKKVPLGEPTK